MARRYKIAACGQILLKGYLRHGGERRWHLLVPLIGLKGLC